MTALTHPPHPRGDIRIRINGEAQLLRLTLGALADIEAALGGGDFAALARRLEHPRIADILVILQALLAGGGASWTIEALRAADLDLAEAARAVAAAFAALEAPGKFQTESADGRAPLGSP